MKFTPGRVDDVMVRPLRKFVDADGWSCEFWRSDQMHEFQPEMGRITQSEPGRVRGPHEHEEQTDYFCFMGPGNFKFYVWDNRPESPTYGQSQTFYMGQDEPATILVPPGVVHAYKNISSTPGILFNSPDKLYGGPHYSKEIDEIDHAGVEDSPFVVE